MQRKTNNARFTFSIGDIVMHSNMEVAKAWPLGDRVRATKRIRKNRRIRDLGKYA